MSADFVDPFDKEEFEEFDEGADFDVGCAGGGSSSSGKESTGRWTREEHNLFVKGLELFGKGWKKIANLIKTRTVVQIRTHAQKYFLKLSKARNGEQHFSRGGTVKRRKTQTNARLLVVALPLQAFMKPEVVAYSRENLQAAASLAAAAAAAAVPASSVEPKIQDSDAVISVQAKANPDAASAAGLSKPPSDASDVPQSASTAPSPLSEASGPSAEEDQEQGGKEAVQADRHGDDKGSSTNPNNSESSNCSAAVAAAPRNPQKMQADVAEGLRNFLSPHIDLSVADAPEWYRRGQGLSSLLQDAASLNWRADQGARVAVNAVTNTSPGFVAAPSGSGGGEAFFEDAAWFA